MENRIEVQVEQGRGRAVVLYLISMALALAIMDNSYFLFAGIVLWLVLEFLDVRLLGTQTILVAEFGDYDEKGHYRLRIKTGHRSYRFYNPAEEFEQHPDFEETGLAQLYYEFRRYGVKCC